MTVYQVKRVAGRAWVVTCDGCGLVGPMERERVDCLKTAESRGWTREGQRRGPRYVSDYCGGCAKERVPDAD